MALNEQVRQLIKELRQAVNDAFAAIDRLLKEIAGNPLWGWVVDAVRNGLNDLRQKVTAFFIVIDRVVASLGSKDALLAAGRSWHEQVAIPANEAAGVFSLDKLDVDDYWSGLAGEAYKTNAPSHAGAFGDLRVVADGIQSSLTAMANEVDGFSWAVVGALTGAITGVAGIVVSVVAPPTAPAAITVAVAAFTVAITLLVNAVTALVGFMNTANGQQIALMQSLDRVKAWPPLNPKLTNLPDWKVNNNI